MHSANIIRYTFLAAGVVGVLFGLLFLFAARQAIGQFGLGAASLPALLFARAEGAALIAVGIADLIAAGDHTGSRALYALVIGNLVIHVLSIAADFSEHYARNAGVWVGLAVHVIFIAAFGYCLVHWRQMIPPRTGK